jgi:hypothetical protein
MCEFYQPPQLAKLWKVSPAKVRGWIELGELLAANLGNASRPRYRVSSEDAEAFWKSRQRRTPAPAKRQQSACSAKGGSR